ncbi:hypothetical protein ACHAQA_001879 [Verticillium albo-atrum]
MARSQGSLRELQHRGSTKRKAPQPAPAPKPAKKPKTSFDTAPPTTRNSSGGPATATAKATAAAATIPPTVPLSAAHASVLADLKTKYDILPALVISSSKIQKRVTYLLQHLRRDSGDPRPRVALLHARPHEVCKMLTIAEQLKRSLAEGAAVGAGARWFQYNMLYAMPVRAKEAEAVDETVLGGNGAAASEASDDDEDDDFETMENRFERAVVPPPSARVTMSLSIFISTVPVPELKVRDGVSVQLYEA